MSEIRYVRVNIPILFSFSKHLLTSDLKFNNQENVKEQDRIYDILYHAG